eukprot:CAMPEP_0197690284 /NCGR_PEP_ID=MMETSP1338-20131121/108144_1 /TAXON_ID=43686 ORGANISM="Pelagodinium beii, Strain RCC1491" /NCGR_SAMPLE_ID=MMETSP1338 /ASSEMBLY_ACC=CAM_ASM_000754 /LENGTH=44 /DNA_ID= /DNA_START= /DNA_END= /DNA_ORIENTATION=
MSPSATPGRRRPKPEMGSPFPVSASCELASAAAYAFSVIRGGPP